MKNQYAKVTRLQKRGNLNFVFFMHKSRNKLSVFVRLSNLMSIKQRRCSITFVIESQFRVNEIKFRILKV